MQLRGVLHLVVRLPDSSPGTIPASATDIFGAAAAAGTGGGAGCRWAAEAACAGHGAGGGRGAGAVSRAGKATAPSGAGELGRARLHAERAVAELTAALRAWGLWADSVRERAEQRLRS